jgi:hypothetical protein
MTAGNAKAKMVLTSALTCVLSPQERIFAFTRFGCLDDRVANPVAGLS